MRFVNADILADQLALDPYVAARLADDLRNKLVARRESFIFETVFSDYDGSKLSFLEAAVGAGYQVVLCFIWIPSAQESIERFAQRASKGGHDVPDDKLRARYPRTMANLARAIRRLPYVLVFDNSDIRRSFAFVAAFENGVRTNTVDRLPEWLAQLVESE